MVNRSADKRDRQNKVRRLRNRETKSEFRTAIKAFDAAVLAGNKEEAEKSMKLSFKLMDSAVNKGTIHHNTADRKKSRMNLKFNKMA
ncbi:MAG: 30S ribosomal protein S20 [Sphaerochaetaceae bacterium]|nr:30S ribosomal protein S20 [Sphaerochaetaceae bacterium]